MPRRKAEAAAEATPPAEPEVPASDTNGTGEPVEVPSANGEKPHPCHKIGPIPMDKNSSVEVAIWQNEVVLGDGRSFLVYNVTLHGSWRDADGTWKPLKSFRGSHLHVLIYCLQRANDWILTQRDPSNSAL